MAVPRIVQKNWKLLTALAAGLLVAGAVLGLLFAFPAAVAAITGFGIAIPSLGFTLTPFAFLASVPFVGQVAALAGIAFGLEISTHAFFQIGLGIHNFLKRLLGPTCVTLDTGSGEEMRTVINKTNNTGTETNQKNTAFPLTGAPKRESKTPTPITENPKTINTNSAPVQ